MTKPKGSPKEEGREEGNLEWRRWSRSQLEERSWKQEGFLEIRSEWRQIQWDAQGPWLVNDWVCLIIRSGKSYNPSGSSVNPSIQIHYELLVTLSCPWTSRKDKIYPISYSLQMIHRGWNSPKYREQYKLYVSLRNHWSRGAGNRTSSALNWYNGLVLIHCLGMKLIPFSAWKPLSVAEAKDFSSPTNLLHQDTKVNGKAGVSQQALVLDQFSCLFQPQFLLE